MDVSRYARFERPGHAVTNDRHRTSAEKRAPVGYDYAHAIVDDHSRLAYVELHPDERAPTVTGFLERALAFYAGHGITAKRLMTDNGFSYVKNPTRAARSPPDPAPDDEALPAPHQRQGRALPPDDGPRVGLRARLPLASTVPRHGVGRVSGSVDLMMSLVLLASR